MHTATKNLIHTYSCEKENASCFYRFDREKSKIDNGTSDDDHSEIL